MQLSADQSDYGPCEGLAGAWGGTDGPECVSASGDGEWRVPGSSATNCHCSAVIAFGVDHGAELPQSHRLWTGDVMWSVCKHETAVWWSRSLALLAAGLKTFERFSAWEQQILLSSKTPRWEKVFIEGHLTVSSSSHWGPWRVCFCSAFMRHIRLVVTWGVRENMALSRLGQLCLTSGNVGAVTRTRPLNQS